MALPSPSFYSTGDEEKTYKNFGSCEAGEYKPDATGWKVRLWNAKGSTGSIDDMTSVKITVRDADGGTDELWTQQHWIQIKSSSGSTGVVDDAMTVFQAVGKNKELSLGDIPFNQYRTLYVRCYPPTDATEGDVDFQLRATYQQPQTSICKWITGLRGNGVVASTGDPFAMSTGSTGGEIDYEAGYALIDNNEVFYGSSGIIDISKFTTGSGTYAIYLNESGAFGMTTGDIDTNQLELYEATISSGTCTTSPTDKRVYLAGLQAGTTGAMPSTPDKGDLYLDITNGIIYGAKTAGDWTNVGCGTFLNLTDTPASYGGEANKFLSVSTGEDEVEFVTPTADEIEVSEIGTATYDDVQDWINNTQSGGRISSSGGTITDDSSGGINISSGTGFIKTTTGDIGLTKSFDWSADSIVSTGLTNNSTNYIYMDYNATGSPQILATTTRSSIRLQDQFTLGKVYKSGASLHIINSGVNLYNAVRRNHERLIEVRGFERASGGVVTESTDTPGALKATAGIFFLGANEITTDAQDTSTGTEEYFTKHYHISGAWTSSGTQQQIDDEYYNATTGLATLTPNRYGVHWVYIHKDSDLNVVYGQGNYTLAQAEIATAPGDLPSMVEDFGILAAKIIIQQGTTGFTSVATAYETLFPINSPPDHNDLGGIQGGAADDYYHLTNTQHSELTDWAGAVTLSTGGAINLVTFSTGGTVNIPSGQEYQINGSEVKLDEWATPTTGTTLDATTGHHGLLLQLTGSTSTYLNANGSWSTPPDTGEVNTASNAGTTGIGIYYTKSTYDLQFKAIHSTGDISVTDSTGTHTINLDVISTGIALDSLGTPSTGTTLDSSTGRHGLLLALDGNTDNYLRGDGSWQSFPGATGGGDVFKRGAFTVGRLTEISTTGGVIKASPFTVTTGDVFDFGAHSAVFTEQAIATTTGTAAINWNSGLKALFTRSTGSAGAVTFSFTAPVKSANLMLIIRGSTAGSTGVITWPTVYWQGGAVPTLTTGVSAIDAVAFYYSTGLTAYLGLGSANFSTV